MKRLLIIFLLSSVAFGLFAATSKVEYAGTSDLAFAPTSARIYAMGQAGVASSTAMDSVYVNPANLAIAHFGISLPSVSLTAFNISTLLSDETTAGYVSEMMNGDDSNAMDLGLQVASNAGPGLNELARLDLGVGIGFKGFALLGNGQLRLHTRVEDGQQANAATIKIVPEFNIAPAIATGLSLIDTELLALDFGASVKFIGKVYMSSINASEAGAIYTGAEATSQGSGMNALANKYMVNTPVMAGYAIPFDLGVNVAIINRLITFSASAKNLNSVYHMRAYEGMGTLAKYLELDGFEDAPDPDPENETFDIIVPWTLNVGCTFAPQVGSTRLIASVEFADILNLIKESEDTDLWQSLLLHINAGLELNVTKHINLRFGVSEGYMSAGLGASLMGVRIEAAYGWKEMGKQLGDKPVDFLTIRCNLGFDNTK